MKVTKEKDFDRLGAFIPIHNVMKHKKEVFCECKKGFKVYGFFEKEHKKIIFCYACNEVEYL